MPSPTPQPINHGTPSGYIAHRKRGETVCVPCREAHKAAVVAWRSVLIICRDCGEEKRRGTKGRCGRCYSRMQRAKKKGAVSK